MPATDATTPAKRIGGVRLARPPAAGLPFLILFAILLAPRAAPCAISIEQWTYKLVSSANALTLSLGFGDVDRDGFTDIVTGSAWYRNPGGNLFATWTQGSFPVGMGAFAVTDVDGDALADIIAQKSIGDLGVYWLEATNAGATAWNSVLVGTVPAASHPEGAQGYRLGQLEAGGKPEVAISSGGGIFYFRIPANPAAGNWPRVRINAAPSDEGFAFGDIDRDGQLDIAATTGDLKGVVWYRNPGTGAPDWSGTQLATFSDATFPDRTELADINRDGRLDVIVTEENGLATGASTVWWAQPPSAFSNAWTPHLITTQGSTNSMGVADVDLDGDTDVILAEHAGTLKLAVWTNNGNGVLNEHVISTGIESHLGARTVDLDHDGDLDVVSIAWNAGQYVHLWRNDNGAGATPVGPNGGMPGAQVITALKAWPNPFNPSIGFAVDMREAAPLEVDIVDAAGRRVRRLHDGFTAAGRLELRWDGTDDAGRRLAAGVYVARAASGRSSMAGKISLLN